jgi:hypothetical protein
MRMKGIASAGRDEVGGLGQAERCRGAQAVHPGLRLAREGLRHRVQGNGRSKNANPSEAEIRSFLKGNIVKAVQIASNALSQKAAAE